MQQRSSRRPSGSTRRNTPPSDDPVARAVGLLARRAHSRWELRRKLLMKGFGADAVEAAIARLAELGYLNDAAFAHSLVRRRGALRGPLALSAELAAKGVDRAEAAAAVAEFGPEAQVASATRLAERLFIRNPAMSYREMLASVGAKLIRRGFPVAVVTAACRSVLATAAQQPED